MSKSITEIARHPARFAVLVVIGLAAMLLAVMNASAAITTPSGFMEGGVTGGDGNVRDNDDSVHPPFDWANSGDGSPPTNTCPAATSGFTVQNLSGGDGLFNCGQGDGQFTTPIAPIPTADGTVGAHHIDASAFKVDPLSSDQATCNKAGTDLTTLELNGDPTTFTKKGGEKNGDSLVLNSTGGNAVETWSTASVPPKDDVSNVYAVSRSGFDDSSLANAVNDALSGTGKELFFGGERVVNNGDTHMDFEFLQAPVKLTDASGTPGSPPNVCEGKFDGHRTHGDFIASIDYTTGGSLGTFSLAQWHCNVDTHSADNSTGWVTDASANPTTLNGKTCDFAGPVCTGAPAVGADGSINCGTGPHYQEVACVDVNGFNTNPDCPGGTATEPNKVCSLTPASACAPGIPVDAIAARTNGTGPVACGGWACRLSDGTTPTGSIGACTASSCIDTNELMEGSVNLKAIGFTRCLNSFIPHTRSSASFTATTKDFELIQFVTCKTAFSWEKVDDLGNRLAGAEFTVSPNPHTNEAASSITVTDCIATPCLGEDKDATVGRFCVQDVVSGTYTIHESVVPSGFIGAPDQTVTKSTTGLTDNVNCPVSPITTTFTNVPGSLQWEKRSDIDGSLQDGATFRVTPDPTLAGGSTCPNPGGIPDPIPNCLEVTDCTTAPAACPSSSADQDPNAGQFKLPRVAVGSSSGTPTARTYTITEVSAKTGFGIDPDPDRTCTVGATLATRDCVVGTRVSDGGTPPRPTQPDPPSDVADDCPDRTADDITTGDANGGSGLTGRTGDDFCNPVGSLFWEKRAKNAGVGDTPLLGGATFKLNKNPHTGAAGDFTGIVDCIVPAVQANCNALEDKDPDAGQFCLSGVVFGAYTITETAAPTNYVKDGTSQSKTVDSSSTCAGTPTDAGDFINIPLSQIEVKFTSLAGPNVTAASIVCADSTPATVAANSENGAADPALTITGNTAANPTVVTTSTPHGLTTGAVVKISGSNSTPSIDGSFPVTVLSPTTFSIPVNVTAAGTAGTASPLDDTDEVFGDGVSTLKPDTYTCTIVIDP